ncbi:MAG: anti-sigma factor antagonist [candidate division Zixibacteria bacterium]|nr:anti-sigma factor antagonist [candidate division Zixibacteria bacterium]
MDIKQKDQGDITILSLNGRLDLESSTRLKSETDSLITDRHNKLIFDFKGVNFINSSGLGALVSILKNVNSCSGKVILTGLAPYVKEVFEITQLSNIFEIYKDERQAMNKLKSM